MWGKPEKQDAHEVRGILETETLTGRTTNCRCMPIVMWLLIIFMSEDLREDPYSQVSAKGTFEGVVEASPI